MLGARSPFASAHLPVRLQAADATIAISTSCWRYMARGSARSMAAAATQHALQACNVYVSEGSNQALISRLRAVAGGQRGAALVNVFVDEPYNRTGFTLVAKDISPLAAAAVGLAKAALQALDLRQHSASHPRLGVVDHISCHPLTAAAELQQAAQLARRIGAGLVQAPHELPVFFYGAASDAGTSLAAIRRSLGYFRGSAAGNWDGAVLQRLPPGCEPNAGPSAPHPARGVALLGAVPWLTNYNIQVRTADLQAGRRIAAAVSQRGGGIEGVEAMALPHSATDIEIACNLLGGGEAKMAEVLRRTQALCRQQGLAVGADYRIGRSPAEYAEMAVAHLGL